MTYIITNPVNRNNYLIQNVMPFKQSLMEGSVAEWLCWVLGAVCFFTTVLILLGQKGCLKPFGCSSNSWGRSCPRAYCLYLKHSAPDRWLLLLHITQVFALVSPSKWGELSPWTSTLKTAIFPPTPCYSLFTPPLHYLSSYHWSPDVLLNSFIEWTPWPHQQEYKLYYSRNFYMFCLLTYAQSLAINVKWILADEWTNDYVNEWRWEWGRTTVAWNLN